MKEIEQRNSPAVNQNTLQLLGPLRNVFWNPPFNLRQGVCMPGRAVSVHGDDSRSRIFGEKANILVELGFFIVPTGVLEMKILIHFFSAKPAPSVRNCLSSPQYQHSELPCFEVRKTRSRLLRTTEKSPAKPFCNKALREPAQRRERIVQRAHQAKSWRFELGSVQVRLCLGLWLLYFYLQSSACNV